MDPLAVLFWMLVVIAGLITCGIIGILIFFGIIGGMILKMGNIFLEELKPDREKKL